MAAKTILSAMSKKSAITNNYPDEVFDGLEAAFNGKHCVFMNPSEQTILTPSLGNPVYFVTDTNIEQLSHTGYHEDARQFSAGILEAAESEYFKGGGLVYNAGSYWVENGYYSNDSREVVQYAIDHGSRFISIDYSAAKIATAYTTATDGFGNPVREIENMTNLQNAFENAVEFHKSKPEEDKWNGIILAAQKDCLMPSWGYCWLQITGGGQKTKSYSTKNSRQHHDLFVKAISNSLTGKDRQTMIEIADTFPS